MTKCCKCVWEFTVCCCYGQQRYIFPHYPSAYVWFIYIHGYPDNEAFNPGDPAVRTMNPITSCRLWDGMVQSQTDGRGCSRPAIQSYSSRSHACFSCPRVLQQLINRLGEPGIIMSWVNSSANAHMHVPWGPIHTCYVPPDHLHTWGFSLPSCLIIRAQILAGRAGQVLPANVLTCVLANQADYSSWFIQNSQDSPFKLNILAACANINHAKRWNFERWWQVDWSGCMCNMTA